ncbi:hypothetical protein VIGAN_05226700, partial [Vigna angularis var. angularis]
ETRPPAATHVLHTYIFHFEEHTDGGLHHGPASKRGSSTGEVFGFKLQPPLVLEVVLCAVKSHPEVLHGLLEEKRSSVKERGVSRLACTRRQHVVSSSGASLLGGAAATPRKSFYFIFLHLGKPNADSV